MAPRDFAPTASTLRHRAAELRRMADAIERAAVFDLPGGDVPPDGATLPRQMLGRRVLDTNLQQLLAAADELRDTAWQFETRANHLDGRSS